MQALILLPPASLRCVPASCDPAACWPRRKTNYEAQAKELKDEYDAKVAAMGDGPAKKKQKVAKEEDAEEDDEDDEDDDEEEDGDDEDGDDDEETKEEETKEEETKEEGADAKDEE
jgi:hypothetical protein